MSKIFVDKDYVNDPILKRYKKEDIIIASDDPEERAMQFGFSSAKEMEEENRAAIEDFKSNNQMISEILDIQFNYSNIEINVPSYLKDHSKGKIDWNYGKYTLNDPLDNKEIPAKINGTEIKLGKHYFISALRNKDKTGIIGVSLEIDETVNKLSDIFDCVPYGVLAKNRTGVGATTLELQSNRDSIIVVPTKNIAYEKHLTKKDQYFYVGSKIGQLKDDVGVPDVESYIDSDVEYKKILVVADSLPKVIKAIGESVYENYFIMIDEIDSYQEDGVFRPSMENTIDYYFRFKSTNRSLVSATIKPFTNPKLQEEPIIQIIYKNNESWNLSTLHTEYILASIYNSTKKLIDKKYPTTIVVAYNKVSAARSIIENLISDGILQHEDCGILCSEASKNNAREYYVTLKEKKLPAKKLIFMTCAYFAGIDIEDRFHLISVSDSRYIYTMMSIEKLKQISGRCRHKDGLLSNLVIYNTNTETLNIDVDKELEELKSMAEEFIKFYCEVNSIITKYPTYVQEYISELKKSISENITGKVLNNTVSIVRTNIGNEVDYAYLNFDHIRDFLISKKELYSSNYGLPSKLEESGCEVIKLQATNTPSDRQLENYIGKRQTEIAKENKNTNVAEIIKKLTDLKTGNLLNNRELAHLYRVSTRETNGFLKIFSDYYKHVPFDELIAKLGELYKSKKDIRLEKKYQNALFFFSLKDNDAFRLRIEKDFPINTRIKQIDFERKSIDIFRQFLNTDFTDKQALQLMRHFVNIEFNSYNKKENIKNGVVKNYDVLGLNCEPLNTRSFNIKDYKTHILFK